MLLDKQNMFSESQAITASAGSTNTIDLDKAGLRIGVGTPVFLVLIVTEAFTDSGSDSTVTPKLETDDNEAFSSATTITTYDVFAALTAINTMRVYSLDPQPTNNYEQYIRVYYTVANGNLSTGKITAALVLDAQLHAVYPSGFSIIS